MLNSGYAVCGGYAFLFRDICDIAELPCEVVNGKATWLSAEDVGHVWNAVQYSGNWYHLDVCWDDTGDGEGTYDFFMRGDTYINISDGPNFRTWDPTVTFNKDNFKIDRNRPQLTFDIIWI